MNIVKVIVIGIVVAVGCVGLYMVMDGQFVAQVLSILVSIVAIVFTARSAERQNREASKENKISLIGRRLDYLELLMALKKNMSSAKDSASRCSSDETFCSSEFVSEMEKLIKSDLVILRLLQNNEIDVSIEGERFFRLSTECLLKKLDEGESIFETEAILNAVEAVRCVFRLAGKFSTDIGVLIELPSDCDVYASVSIALQAIDEGVKLGKAETRIK